jgi:multidrug efflux pump subunit AcrB
MLVRMDAGMKAKEAAGEAVGKTIWALLGGTVIGIMAFSAIGLSQDNTGEFASSLFYVILISLALSWVTAISTTPLLCALLLKPDPSAGEKDPYAGVLFKAYRGILATAINHRWVTLGAVVGLFVLAVIGFGHVKSGFFPESNTPIFFVDMWEPEGADIRTTRDDTLRVSAFIRPRSTSPAAVVGTGAGHYARAWRRHGYSG